MLEGKKWEAWLALHGGDEDAARAMLDEMGVDGANRAIEDGMIARAAEEAEPEAEEEQETEPQAFILDDAAVEAIADQVAGGFAERFEALGAQLDAALGRLDQIEQRAVREHVETDERLRALEREDAEKQREWVEDLPRSRPTRVTYRPRVDRAPEGDGETDLGAVAAETLAHVPPARGKA